MDGAMGTELLRAGVDPLDFGETDRAAWRAAARSVHRSYVKVGARILLTASFQVNPCSLQRAGRLNSVVHTLLQEAVADARAMSSPGALVLGDIGPLATIPANEEFPPEWLEDVVHGLAGADALLLETCSTPSAFRAAGIAHALSQGSQPVLLSMTFRKGRNGTLQCTNGLMPEEIACMARDYHLAALGVNCGRELGLEDVTEVVRRYRSCTDLPLFARPNAGTPVRMGDAWDYPLTPSAMAAQLPGLLEAGVAMVGGCCGTTPAHIAAMRPVVEAWNRNR